MSFSPFSAGDRSARRLLPSFRTGRQQHRRGAEAIEFALLFPVLLVMLFATFDYGLLFYSQFQANSIIHSSLRTGTHINPSEYERGYGGCDECITVVGTTAAASLDAIGIHMAAADLQPQIVSRAGVCALVIEAQIPHTPVIGLFSVPDHYFVSTAVPAQRVPVCN